MSLIFLKNDDNSVKSSVLGSGSNMKPYKWRNYFTSPIKLAPNSQVAFIKTQFQSTEVGDFEDATAYMYVGIPQLNPPIPLYLSENNVADITQYVNNIGLACNTYGCDGDYNHIFMQPNQSVLGQSNLQDEYETGFNWVLKDDKKVSIRATQRGINNIYNQGYNNCGMTVSVNGGLSPTPNGIESGTGDDTTLFKENGFFHTGLGGTNGPFVYSTPTNLIAHQSVGAPIYFSNSSARYYNPNYAFAQMGGPLQAPIQLPIVDVNSLFPYNFSSSTGFGDVFCVAGSATGIKKNVFMDGAPDANRNNPNGGGAPVGHPSIAGAGSGGYSNIFVGNLAQPDADVVYPAPLFPANRVGFTGITPCSFGVNSVDVIDLEFADNVSQSRENFRDLMDLNNADPALQNALLGKCDFTRAIGGYARYLFGVDIMEVGGDLKAICKILNPNPVGGSFVESRYLDCASLSLGELSAGYNDIDGVAFAGGAQGGPSIFSINIAGPATGGRNEASINFRIRWTSPYTMCVEYCLDTTAGGGGYRFIDDTPYLPADGTGDPTSGWCMLYDMKNDPDVKSNYLIPSYAGDMRVVMYQTPVARTAFGINGYFDNRYSNNGGSRDTTNTNSNVANLPYFYKLPVDGTDGLALPLVQDFTGGYTTPKLGNAKGEVEPEEFIATGANAGISKKKIHFLLNSVVGDATRQFVMDELGNPIFNIYDPPNLHLGSQLGIISSTTPEKDLITLSDDITGIGVDYVLYGKDGTTILNSGNDDFTLHFQLTNFGIKSQQGVKSTEYKSIMVVNKIELSEKVLNPYSAYNYTHPTPLWIDLNNYGEINMNGIDVKITDDDNNEAKQLKGKTNLVIAFRAKPKRDEGYVPDNIPVVNRVPMKNAFGETETMYK